MFCYVKTRCPYEAWELFIFSRHLQWEPAEIACDYEEGDLFQSADPHGKLR